MCLLSNEYVFSELLWVESWHSVVLFTCPFFFPAVGTREKMFCRQQEIGALMRPNLHSHRSTVQVVVSRSAWNSHPSGLDESCIRTVHTIVPSIASDTYNLFLGHIYWKIVYLLPLRSNCSPLKGPFPCTIIPADILAGLAYDHDGNYSSSLILQRSFNIGLMWLDRQLVVCTLESGPVHKLYWRIGVSNNM